MKSDEYIPSPQKLDILLADDDNDDCQFFKEALDELPLHTQLTAVHDGEQLLQLLSKKMNDLPHVLFLDLNLPRKNGFACLEEIKRNEKLKELPVIIFSTSYSEHIANQLYKNGAQYYICKPADFSQLKKLILQALTFITKENISQPSKEKFLLSLKSMML